MISSAWRARLEDRLAQQAALKKDPSCLGDVTRYEKEDFVKSFYKPYPMGKLRILAVQADVVDTADSMIRTLAAE